MLAYRETGRTDRPAVLMLHGYPESSFMWEGVMPAVADAGWRAIAPDLAGFGDSAADPPGTWERHIVAVERFRQELGIERCVPVVHDWGGLIGLRWACDHPDAVEGLIITDSGFFPDGRWHGIGELLRRRGEGEKVIRDLDRGAFDGLMLGISPAIPPEALDEYWKCVADTSRRACILELYRSGDFEKLEPYRGRLGEFHVPTLIVWGAKDEFAPVGGAYRFSKQIPGSRLVVLERAGHWLLEDDPGRVAAEVRQFLEELRASSTSVRTPNPEAPEPV